MSSSSFCVCMLTFFACLLAFCRARTTRTIFSRVNEHKKKKKQKHWDYFMCTTIYYSIIIIIIIIIISSSIKYLTIIIATVKKKLNERGKIKFFCYYLSRSLSLCVFRTSLVYFRTKMTTKIELNQTRAQKHTHTHTPSLISLPLTI